MSEQKELKKFLFYVLTILLIIILLIIYQLIMVFGSINFVLSLRQEFSIFERYTCATIILIVGLFSGYTMIKYLMDKVGVRFVE